MSDAGRLGAFTTRDGRSPSARRTPVALIEEYARHGGHLWVFWGHSPASPVTQRTFGHGRACIRGSRAGELGLLVTRM
ncbi:hypothetical protein G3I77_20220 [Streptomyces sp. D2-8]|nr:hypothetical protein [Streptomyces sp. D2-8]